MPNPRPWPNTAIVARDAALTEAARGLRALCPMLDTRFTLEEQYRRIAVAIDALHRIEGAMKASPQEREREQAT